MAARTAIVEEEAGMGEHCAPILGWAGHRCLATPGPARAPAGLEPGRPDPLPTDLEMPGVDGMELPAGSGGRRRCSAPARPFTPRAR